MVGAQPVARALATFYKIADEWGVTLHPAVVKLDTEGEFETLDGAGLVEAMVFDWLGYEADEDYFARIVAFCARHGIALAARSRDELAKAQVTVDPALLHDRLYRSYQPFTPPEA